MEAGAKPASATQDPKPEGTVKASAKAPTLAVRDDPPSAGDARGGGQDGAQVTETSTARTLSGSRRRRVLWASAAIMVGGMAVAMIPVIAPTASSSASAADSAPAARPAANAAQLAPQASEAPVEPAANDSLSGAKLRLAAVAELERELAEGSSRFQRLAGIALARISHPQALVVLRELLKTENSDLSRIDIAYGLALGGQEEGRSYLVAELKNKRRDARIDAARRLVQLKDDAGRDTLVQMLGIRSHRLGAATELAQLEDERGVLALRETLEDAQSSEENKMRAAVGLGRAGDQSARDYLKEILSEGLYVVDAAGALAVLGESEAKLALLRQLELTSMRVRAASSLKTLGEEVDLSLLAAALKTGNTDGRIAAAEAILLLTATEEQN